MKYYLVQKPTSFFDVFYRRLYKYYQYNGILDFETGLEIKSITKKLKLKCKKIAINI